ncbi:MAG: hypothetical protein DRH17_01815 [Deltaproteobacteria bacterium]|nr:MAG: hypothetical protein DRH17_01815 [Deltaproteobacteria bacterium]
MKKCVRKVFLQNLLIVCGSILLFLLGAEGTLRILYPKALNVHYNFPHGFFCKRDPLLGWIGQPNISGVMSYPAEDMDDLHVVMNTEGFWDRTHKTPKSPGVKRLLFLGDSFTIGWGIRQEERFTNIIKDRLSADCEVINMGMWGYSTDQELLVFTEKGLKYRPDVVILVMFLDDLFCSRLFSVNDGIYIKPKFALSPNDDLELCNVPVPDNHGRSVLLNMVLTRFYKLRNRLEMGVEFDRRGWLSVFDKAYLKQKGYYLSLRLLSEICAVAKGHNMKFLVVIVPWKDQLRAHPIYAAKNGYAGIPPGRLDFSLPQRVVTLFCEKMGIPVLDLLPVFKEHDCPERLFFKHDCHWTKAGHRLAAEQILAYLRKLNYP